MEKLNEVAAFLDRNPGLADCVVQITYSEMYDIAEAFRALEQRAEAAESTLVSLVGVVRSINFGQMHIAEGVEDDEPCYWQRKEWIEYVLSICDDAELLTKAELPC